ncbi:MAG: DNA repair protein RecO [Acidobacteria bacterium]|nr:DNA repair protein RecO [Acidobacteriota bacterium]MBW4044812.1 DNA repair protein RecO [Acidobacteriota bacterium]
MAHSTEAVVLRTWPMHEADLIVSLFTRDQGKVKGVAKAASKSRRRFGGALEPMTHVRASYAERPRQELARLDAFEIIHSPLSEPVDYGRATALAFYAEVLEETLQDHDPQDAVFRLLLAVVEQTQVNRFWMPVTYFSLWILRLNGWLPEMTRCALCGEPFGESPAYWHPLADTLHCATHRRDGSATLSPESIALAAAILRSPVAAFASGDWPRRRAADLRRYALRSLERHLERRLTTATALMKLGG